MRLEEYRKMITQIVVVYGIILSILVGAFSYVSYENIILKERLADVQETVRMLEEELQEAYKID